MNVEYINSFYKSIREVLYRMINVNVEMGNAKLGTSFTNIKGTGILINLTGELDGYVLFIFPDETAIKMVNNMSGLDMKEVDKFVHSALAEMVNIISGNAVTLITSLGKISDISTPEVYTSDFDGIIRKNTIPLKIPIKSDMGMFEMNIYILENEIK